MSRPLKKCPEVAVVSSSRRAQEVSARGFAKTSVNSRGLVSAQRRKATAAARSWAPGSSAGIRAAAAVKASVAALSISKATRSTSSW